MWEGTQYQARKLRKLWHASFGTGPDAPPLSQFVAYDGSGIKTRYFVERTWIEDGVRRSRHLQVSEAERLLNP